MSKWEMFSADGDVYVRRDVGAWCVYNYATGKWDASCEMSIKGNYGKMIRTSRRSREDACEVIDYNIDQYMELAAEGKYKTQENNIFHRWREEFIKK